MELLGKKIWVTKEWNGLMKEVGRRGKDKRQTEGKRRDRKKMRGGKG